MAENKPKNNFQLKQFEVEISSILRIINSNLYNEINMYPQLKFMVLLQTLLTNSCTKAKEPLLFLIFQNKMDILIEWTEKYGYEFDEVVLKHCNIKSIFSVIYYTLFYGHLIKQLKISLGKLQTKLDNFDKIYLLFFKINLFLSEIWKFRSKIEQENKIIFENVLMKEKIFNEKIAALLEEITQEFDNNKGEEMVFPHFYNFKIKFPGEKYISDDAKLIIQKNFTNLFTQLVEVDLLENIFFISLEMLEVLFSDETYNKDTLVKETYEIELTENEEVGENFNLLEENEKENKLTEEEIDKLTSVIFY